MEEFHCLVLVDMDLPVQLFPFLTLYSCIFLRICSHMGRLIPLKIYKSTAPHVAKHGACLYSFYAFYTHAFWGGGICIR